MDLGMYINKLRLNKGISQTKLAELLGISSAAVSKWENGTSEPDLFNICFLSKFFGVTVDDLIYFNEDKLEQSKNKNILGSYTDIYGNFDFNLIKNNINIVKEFIIKRNRYNEIKNEIFDKDNEENINEFISLTEELSSSVFIEHRVFCQIIDGEFNYYNVQDWIPSYDGNIKNNPPTLMLDPNFFVKVYKDILIYDKKFVSEKFEYNFTSVDVTDCNGFKAKLRRIDIRNISPTNYLKIINQIKIINKLDFSLEEDEKIFTIDCDLRNIIVDLCINDLQLLTYYLQNSSYEEVKYISKKNKEKITNDKVVNLISKILYDKV